MNGQCWFYARFFRRMIGPQWFSLTKNVQQKTNQQNCRFDNIQPTEASSRKNSTGYNRQPIFQFVREHHPECFAVAILLKSTKWRAASMCLVSNAQCNN